MLLEIHCHTSKHSRCSHVDPVTVVKQILKKQLQGLILTEHHYLWSGDEILELRKKAEVSESFVILSGQEVETDIGHVVVYGAPVTIPGRMKLGELRVSFPEAALIWAHPFRNGKRPDREALLDKRLDAVEIFSSNHTPKENYLGLAMWHELKFTAVSGTDTHSETTAGILPTQLDHPVKTVSDFAGEIKAARCRPFFKEIPHAGSNIVVTEITLGTKGETEIRDRIIIKEFTDEKKWNKAKETVAILEGLYAKGLSDGEFRVPRVIDVNDPSHIIIEEGQRGKNLFELISTVTPASGREYFRLAARWLAAFHYCGCLAGAAIQDPGREDKKFASYLKSFRETRSPYVRLAEEILPLLSAREKELSGLSSVFCHGDYHPKNIIIGRDRIHDMSTQFVSVIDFDSAVLMPRAFDVGYFLSQFRSQFFGKEEVLSNYTDEEFVEAYLSQSPLGSMPLASSEVAVFCLRANLSIASFLIKVGKGTSPEMEDVMSRSRGLMALVK